MINKKIEKIIKKQGMGTFTDLLSDFCKHNNRLPEDEEEFISYLIAYHGYTAEFFQ